MGLLLQSVNQMLKSYKDLGLLLFRLGLGGMFIWHGWPKITGGVALWTGLGKTMALFGITFAPAFWGFMSAFAEFFGGILLLVGFFYRWAAFLLAFNMLIAFGMHMATGQGLAKASQPVEDGFSFLGALFVGPGKYSLDYYLGLEKDGD